MRIIGVVSFVVLLAVGMYASGHLPLADFNLSNDEPRERADGKFGPFDAELGYKQQAPISSQDLTDSQRSKRQNSYAPKLSRSSKSSQRYNNPYASSN